MQDGPEKTRLWRELQDKGAFGSLRMFVGRNTEGEPTIALNDSRGRQRLRLSVDTDDTPVSPWLREGLVEAARAMAHTKNTYLSAQYHRIAARRGAKRAAVSTPAVNSPQAAA